MRIMSGRVSPTIAVAGAATFGALAAMLTIVLVPVLQPSFPILLYLKFDFAEVMDVIAFLVFGPVAGLLTAIVHGGILAGAPGGGGPFGASLKFLAVLTTYSGIYLSIIFFAQFLFNQNYLFFAQLTLANAGINLTGEQLIGYVLGLTAVFNAVHAVF